MSSVDIRYEEIVAAYERDLQTRLRGFRPQHEFLESWVHDEDPARSLLNMVEAAELGGVKDLGIEIGPETAQRLDQKRLQEMVSKVGRTSLEPRGAGLLLKVAYG